MHAPSRPRSNPESHFALFAMLVILVAAGLLMSCPVVLAAPPAILYGTAQRPLTGARYQTMRSLSRYFDTTAQGALEGAVDDARHGASPDA
ncbi:MAG TPA: hypothetical protein VFE68_11460, partial [Vicinamibacteria bacterium]|nr:hypothetical protein [Vicinamibacteria bacterium]